MSELTIVMQWTLTFLHVMLTHLSFEFEFHRVMITLVVVEIIKIRLLSHVPHDFGRRVIVILLLTTILIIF
jgi:hypothetical protein